MEKMVRILVIIGAILAAIQTFLSINGIPGLDVKIVLSISGIVGVLSSINTAWYQIANTAVNTKLSFASIAVAIIATLGGLNEIFGYIPIAPEVAKWVTFSISMLMFIFQVLSKVLSEKMDGAIK